MTDHRPGWPATPLGGHPGAVVAFFVLLLLPAVSRALEWDYVPNASAGAGYETNVNGARNFDDARVRDTPEDDGYLLLGSVDVEFTGRAPTSQVVVRPTVDVGLYAGRDANAFRDDHYINYSLPVTARETWQTAGADISGGYLRTSTQTLVNTTNPNNPQRPGINTTSLSTEYEERWYVAPSLQYQLTPKDVIGLSMSYDDVNFTEAQFSGQSDYSASSADLSWERALTARTRISLGANASGFQATGQRSLIENDTLTYGASAGYQFKISETSSLGLYAGASRSDVKVKNLPFVSTGGSLLPCLDPVQNVFVPCTLKGTDNNFVGRLFFRQQTARTITTEFSVSRSVEPNSDGSQVTLNVANAYITKQFGPLLSGQLGASYSEQNAVASQGGEFSQRFSRNYLQVNASITRRMSRTWALRGEYFYKEDQQSAGTSYTVPNHRLNFVVEFNGIGGH